MADIIHPEDVKDDEQIVTTDNTEILDVVEEAAGTEDGRPKRKKSRISDLFDMAETFCYSLVLMVILFVFVFRFVTVDGGSMNKTLTNGDKLIISDLFYTPQTGDIVVLSTDGVEWVQNHPYIIKRIIAVGGDEVTIDFENWRVTVNDKVLEEEYVNRVNDAMHTLTLPSWKTKGEEGAEADDTYDLEYNEADGTYSFTVPEGRVFVMGDNRNNSLDSRAGASLEEGCLEVERILGRVLLRVTPTDSFGRVK